MPMNSRLLRPRASGFNPKSIAGLIAWFDGADSSTMGPTASGVAAVSNNGPVMFWKDKSNSGYNMTGVATLNSPTFVSSSLNGKSALSFDGNDQVSGAAASGAIMTAPFTLFVVARATVTGTTRVCGVGSNRSIGPFATSNTNWGFFSAGGVQSFGVSATAASVLCMTANASLAGTFFGNGTQSATGTLVTVTPGSFAAGTDVGGGATGTFTGIVYEILSYDSVLSSDARSRVTRWLGSKWGITVA